MNTRKALPKNHQSDLALRYSMRSAGLDYRIHRKHTTIIYCEPQKIHIHIKRVAFKWYEVSTFQAAQLKTSLCIQYISIDEVIEHLKERGFYDRYEKRLKKAKPKTKKRKGFSSNEIHILKSHGLTLAEIVKVQAVCRREKMTFEQYLGRYFGRQLKLAV
ncbi:hypothetical protein [Roseivirga pacifica]|uniref:hypothetical protein n=1 Tax=Roseivirga pacifica TaxID=1267423 RepID=UPI003BA891AF